MKMRNLLTILIVFLSFNLLSTIPSNAHGGGHGGSMEVGTVESMGGWHGGDMEVGTVDGMEVGTVDGMEVGDAICC